MKIQSYIYLLVVQIDKLLRIIINNFRVTKAEVER